MERDTTGVGGEYLIVDREVCAEDYERYIECAKKSADEWANILMMEGSDVDGLDGKANFMERKTCNAMTTILEDCYEIMTEHCFGQAQVYKTLDHRVYDLLTILQKPTKAWDPEKCPAVRSMVERMENNPNHHENSRSGAISSSMLAMIALYVASFA